MSLSHVIIQLFHQHEYASLAVWALFIGDVVGNVVLVGTVLVRGDFPSTR